MDTLDSRRLPPGQKSCTDVMEDRVKVVHRYVRIAPRQAQSCWPMYVGHGSIHTRDSVAV